jgi:hypothetical protein
MALPMLAMLYRQNGLTPPDSHQQSHLMVFTEKASLAAIDGDSRGSRPWARDDSSAAYDNVDWDTIGARCKAKDVACSCVIVASEPSRTAAQLGRDGSASAERLKNMCQTVSHHPRGAPDC